MAKVIKARRSLKGERDVFVVSLGRFDSHNVVTDNIFLPLLQLNAGLTSFVEEMRDEGVWDNIVVPVVSEFGRTITSNGAGTDHAWAGNAVVLGGALNGSRILGDFPQGLGTDADVRISRGRLIPTTPWESLWQPIAEWFSAPLDMVRRLLLSIPSARPALDALARAKVFPWFASRRRLASPLLCLLPSCLLPSCLLLYLATITSEVRVGSKPAPRHRWTLSCRCAGILGAACAALTPRQAARLRMRRPLKTQEAMRSRRCCGGMHAPQRDTRGRMMCFTKQISLCPQL